MLNVGGCGSACCIVAGLAVMPTALAQNADIGQSICYEAERTVNALADFTRTTCLPSRGRKAGTYGFIVLSGKAVLANDKSKKVWTLIATAAVGKALNDRPGVKGDELWLSDAPTMKRRQAYVVPASLAQSLQRRVHGGQISLDQMYAELGRHMKLRTIEGKK